MHLDSDIWLLSRITVAAVSEALVVTHTVAHRFAPCERVTAARVAVAIAAAKYLVHERTLARRAVRIAVALRAVVDIHAVHKARRHICSHVCGTHRNHITILQLIARHPHTFKNKKSKL